MKKRGFKKFLLALLVLFLLYGLWLGIHLSRFQTYKGNVSKPPESEILGAYHIHSIYSDGHKTIDKIAELASQAGIDFIILSDHGNPNRKSLAEQGWKLGVLVLAGSELSTNRGHLVALGFTPPAKPFSRVAEIAAAEISSAEGISVIAHPYSKTSWTWGDFSGYSGIEILNAYSPLQRKFILLLPYLPALLILPEYGLLKMLEPPRKNLKKWDELNIPHPVYGFFSIDAHLLYRPLLNLFHLHLSLHKPLSPSFEEARAQVFRALRRGRFYNAIDAAAEAKGFKFWAESEGRKIPMGARVKFQSPLQIKIRAPFPFAKEMHIIHSGKKILVSQKDNIIHEVTEPGTYRVELYLRERTPLGKNVPWIISNPIFLQREEP